MTRKPLDPTNSPLTAEQAEGANRLVDSLTPEQMNWLSGYLAGLHAASPEGQTAASPGAPAAAAAPTLTILYGSETGNAESVAEQAGEQAAARGIPARVVDMADYKTRNLRDEQLLMIVTATHGEGDPPDPATGFHEFVHGRKAPKLQGAKFAVLGLGDTSYEHFCQTGKDFDARLEELGAERLLERVDCDVDFEEAAEQWIGQALDAFAEHAQPPEPAASATAPQAPGAATSKTGYNRKNPFHAEVLENLVLTGRGSEKETRHVELSLEGSGIEYEPGDVLSVVPTNREEVVQELIEVAGLDPAETVTHQDDQVPLADALRHGYEISPATPPFAQAYAEWTGAEDLVRLTTSEPRSALMEYLEGRDVVDLLREYPPEGLDAATLLGMLRKLQPREYSIASSYRANPEEVHLTVDVVRYENHGRLHHGVASTFLAQDAEPGATVPIFIRSNKNFRLPSDPATPIIMVGPGTGIAPFRAFLQEREELEAEGAHWLFFGNPYLRTDFLYQTEWQAWHREGLLDRLDVAFSRDQAEKVYVQDRMREHGAELFRWLEDGAHVYVCGDAERMAPAVHAALEEVVQTHGGYSEEGAAEYVKSLQSERRYQRDVY